MAEISDTATNMGFGPCLIQNLGPDIAYVGGDDVTDENGFQLAANESLSVMGSNSSFYVVSAGTSDIRILARATGVFATPSSA